MSQILPNNTRRNFSK